MTLRDAQEGKEYIIKSIVTEDEELDAFLFSLGCYSGEPITVVSHIKGGCVVSIKDGDATTSIISWQKPLRFSPRKASLWQVASTAFFRPVVSGG